MKEKVSLKELVLKLWDDDKSAEEIAETLQMPLVVVSQWILEDHVPPIPLAPVPVFTEREKALDLIKRAYIDWRLRRKKAYEKKGLYVDDEGLLMWVE